VSERIATTEARLEGFYWVILGQNPPEIAYWERGEWWLAGEPRPWPAGGGDRRQRSPGIQAEAGAGGMSYPHRERRRAAELKELRAELVKRLGQLDFRAENLEQAFAEMARHVERTIRRLAA
jgi:hypothetical protein